MRGGKYLILVLVLITIIPFVLAYPSCEQCVAYYAFENNTLDLAGDNDGTNHGASFVPGFGLALDFDGDDYVSVPDSSDLDITDEITISMWVKGNESSNLNTRYVIGKPNAYAIQIVRIPPYGPEIVIRLRNSANTGWHSLYTGADVLDDTWKHITATYDGDKMRLYVNGGLVSTSSSIGDTIYASGVDLTIGAYSPGYARFNGTIDEVKIFDYAQCVIDTDCDDSNCFTDDTCVNGNCQYAHSKDQLFIYQGNYQKLISSLGDDEDRIERLARLIAKHDIVDFTHGFTLGPANWTNGKCRDGAYPLLPDLMKRVREIKPDIKIFVHISGHADNPDGPGNGTFEQCPGGICSDFVKWVNLYRTMENDNEGVVIDGIVIDWMHPSKTGWRVRDNVFSYVKNVNKTIMANLLDASDTAVEWVDASAYFNNSEDYVLFEGYYVEQGILVIQDTIDASEKANELGVKFVSMATEARNVNVTCSTANMKAAYNMSYYYGGDFFTYQGADIGTNTTMWTYCPTLICGVGKYYKGVSEYLNRFHMDWDTGQKTCCSGQYDQINANHECVTSSVAYNIGVYTKSLVNDTYAAPNKWGWLDCDDSTYAENYCNNSNICPGGLVYAGELGVGEYTNMTDQACCGDDPNEYYVVNVSNSACCDNPTDQVNSSDNCY